MMAATTRFLPSVLACGTVVSTVRIGRGGRYETAYMVGGVWSDSEVSSTPGEATYVHDRACDVVNAPSMREAGNARTERLVRLLEGVRADAEAVRGIGAGDLAPVLAAARIERLG